MVSIRVGLLGKHMKAHKTNNMFQMIGAVCYQHKNTLAIGNISKITEFKFNDEEDRTKSCGWTGQQPKNMDTLR